MFRLTALLVIAAMLIACSKSSEPSPATPAPVATSTPDTRDFLFDMSTLDRVYDIAGTGRIALGVLNTVFIDRANARRTGFYAGNGLPSAEYLNLSIIMSAARDGLVAIDGRSHVSYEWWFVVEDAIDVPAEMVAHDQQPNFRLAVRQDASGQWQVYRDFGLDWYPVASATYQIGEYEVSARVPLTEAYGMDRLTTTTFFRAVTRDERGLANDDRRFGYVFPDDLSWREVIAY